MRPLENLSKRQREATPRRLAEWLIEKVGYHFSTVNPGFTVACLWVQERSVYETFENTECWGRCANANLYAGPYPIIAHPPCGPWGNYRNKSHESIDHGIKAMELVHRWGGVVEHPLSSPLFEIYGRGGWVQKIDQADFGHQAKKTTLLYWYLN